MSRPSKQSPVLWPLNDPNKQFEEYKAQLAKELKESPEFKKLAQLLCSGRYDLRFSFKMPRKRGRPKGSKNKPK
jgi:hypothetical protein